MLVLKVPKGERVSIYDKTDGSVPPITIMLVTEGNKTRLMIDADQRYGILREGAKCKVPQPKGGKDAQPIPA